MDDLERQLTEVGNEMAEIARQEEFLNNRMERLMEIERRIRNSLFLSKTETFFHKWGVSDVKVREDFINTVERNSYPADITMNYPCYYIEINNLIFIEEGTKYKIQHKSFYIIAEKINACKIDKKTDEAFDLLRLILPKTVHVLLFSANEMRISDLDYNIGSDEYKVHLEK